MIRGVHHVAISTPDLDRFVDHYERWFGFERCCEGGWEKVNAHVDRMIGLPGSAARYVMIRLSGFYIEVFEFAAPLAVPVYPRMCDVGLTHLCLYCEDVFAEHERPARLGHGIQLPARR